MGSGNSTGTVRKRAAALKALDARELLGDALPDVLKIMTNAQIQQMQSVLDAAVMNPVLQQEYADTMRRSVVSQHGMVVQRDERIVRKANRIFEQQVPISKSDKRIRIDVEALLTADAFALKTNNPDEAEFLRDLAESIGKKGVWLRFEPRLVRDPEDPSRSILDPRSFEVWLSYGDTGGPIPTKTGIIDQAALLGNQVIGASYYKAVHRGPFMREMDSFMSKLFEEIQDGHQEHIRQDNVRFNAFPGVPAVSDWAGDAEYPQLKMWDTAWNLYHKAWKERLKGDVVGAASTLINAAIVAEANFERLNEYVDRTTNGAAKVAVFIEKVAVVIAVIESLNIFRSTITFLVRRWARQAVTTGVRTAATSTVKNSVRDADLIRRGNGYHKDLNAWLKKNPTADMGDTLIAIERFERRWGVREMVKGTVAPGPKGTVLSGGKKAGQSTGNQGLGDVNWF